MNGPTNGRFRTASNVFASGMRSSQLTNVGRGTITDTLIPRLIVLAICIAIGIIALVVKLWQLQFLDYDKYFDNAVTNTLKHARSTPPRGEITDSSHNLLATRVSM
jgi:cell division protein FtsI/penicillin-binding protein 2